MVCICAFSARNEAQLLVPVFQLFILVFVHMATSRHHFAKQCCTLHLFSFRIADFLDDPCVRDQHVVELWSGVASIVRAANAKGLNAVPFDKFRRSGVTEVSEDILTKDGFHAAVRCVLSLVSGGLLWMAPVCSSFGFMNSSNCKRSAANSWRGDETYESVQDGNLGADIACFLFWLAWARGVEVAMENPSKSAFWKYGSVVSLCECLQLSTALANRCAYDVAPFGRRPLKQYKFLASGSWIEETARACKCPNGAHKKLVINDERGVTGIPKELQASAAYPRKLGVAIVAAWHRRSSGSEMGSGVAVHKPSSSSRKRWAQSSSDSSNDSVRLPVQRVRKQHKSTSSSSGVPARTFLQSSSDESLRPVRPARGKRNWLQASDSE